MHTPSCTCTAHAGSVDRTVRLWDLAAGLPLCSSPLHGGTVRCLALGATRLASGASDAIVRVWEAAPPPAGVQEELEFELWDLDAACIDVHGDHASDASDSDDRGCGIRRGAGGSSSSLSPVPLFDVSRSPYLLRGHTGPISCMCLTETADSRAGRHGSVTHGSASPPSLASTHRKRSQKQAQQQQHGPMAAGEHAQLYSGSWDCSVRLWGPGSSDSSSGGGGGSGDESGGWVCRDVLR